MNENRVDDDEKVVINKTYHDVLGLGQASESLVYIVLVIVLGLTCSNSWGDLFKLFQK